MTRLALAGCTEAEIATLTGHLLRDVRSIFDAHYCIAIPLWQRTPFRSSKREQNLKPSLKLFPMVWARNSKKIKELKWLGD